MKAIVQNKYGAAEDSLELKDVEKPVPKDDEVLVKIYAASVNYSNTAFVRGKPFIVRMMGSGIFKPKCSILGTDIAGQVEVAGKYATQFQPGDAVYGDLSD